MAILKQTKGKKMAKALSLILILIFMGCSYFDDPQSIFRDPHYTRHRDKVERLELDYLHKRISYAEYRAKMKQLDDDYTREVQDRESVILGEE